jgi:hypothetical protein
MKATVKSGTIDVKVVFQLIVRCVWRLVPGSTERLAYDSGADRLPVAGAAAVPAFGMPSWLPLGTIRDSASVVCTDARRLHSSIIELLVVSGNESQTNAGRKVG